MSNEQWIIRETEPLFQNPLVLSDQLLDIIANSVQLANWNLKKWNVKRLYPRLRNVNQSQTRQFVDLI